MLTHCTGILLHHSVFLSIFIKIVIIVSLISFIYSEFKREFQNCWPSEVIITFFNCCTMHLFFHNMKRHDWETLFFFQNGMLQSLVSTNFLLAETAHRRLTYTNKICKCMNIFFMLQEQQEENISYICLPPSWTIKKKERKDG